MSRASFSRISSRLRRSFSCCHVIITSPPRPHHVPATSCHVPAAHGRPPGHHQVIIKQSRLRRSFSCCHVIITSPPRPRHIMSYPRRARPRSRHSSETACAGRLFGPRSRPPSHPVTSPLVTIHFESRPRHGGGGHPVCHFARGRHGVVPVHEILLRRPAGTRAMGGGPLVHGTNDTSCMPSRLRSKRRGLAGKILAPPMALSAWELRPPSAMTWGLKFRTPRIMV